MRSTETVNSFPLPAFTIGFSPPNVTLKLDVDLLGQFPEGYRHLAYLQSKLGFKIKRDMPGLKGEVVQALYARGANWLAGEAAWDTPPVRSGI